MTGGKAMSSIGGGMNAASSFLRGDNASGVMYLGSVIIGGRSAKLIGESQNLNSLSKSLLEHNVRLKLSGTEKVINNQRK